MLLRDQPKRRKGVRDLNSMRDKMSGKNFIKIRVTNIEDFYNLITEAQELSNELKNVIDNLKYFDIDVQAEIEKNEE